MQLNKFFSKTDNFQIYNNFFKYFLKTKICLDYQKEQIFFNKKKKERKLKLGLRKRKNFTLQF